MSITHDHVCAVIHTEIAGRPPGSLRILDVGCGNGRLIAHLQAQLPQLQPGLEPDIRGFDVTDSDIQQEGFFDEAVAYLGGRHPGVEWPARLTRIASSDRWPYADGQFDVVVSNQVVEHIHDHDFVFGEIARVLAPGGLSVHVFPLQRSIMEWHVNVPFAHWSKEPGEIARRIRVWNAFGLGKYRKHKAQDPNLSLDAYAASAAERVLAETNYTSVGALREWSRQHGLECSFRYTGGFYHNRARLLLGRPIKYRYKSGSWEHATLPLYSLIASVTMVLNKAPAVG